MTSLRSGMILPLMIAAGLSVRGQDLRLRPIADSLRRNAAVVERLGLTEIDIKSRRKAMIRRRFVYTILNAAGDGYATVGTYYDRFHELISATAVLYDANGKPLKKISKDDMEDRSEAGSGILMTDSRVKRYHFTSRSYPYTVSYEEEVEQSGLFVLPEWRPQPSPGMAVENSRLVVKTPVRFPLHYRWYGDSLEGSVTLGGGEGGIYSWQMQNRPAVHEEPYAPGWSREEPGVLLAAGEFDQGGYSGRLDSWDDLGAFVEQLYRGRDQLPEEAKRRVHAMVDGLTGEGEKIDTLYSFLQHDTHYVGIELGIGGWQPFDASYVYSMKYGDCKALANYMVALLKEAGVSAYTVLIRGGENAAPMDTGFVCSQFNHAIVVAIAGGDSVWLECTNPDMPAGYLSSYTSDRYGLLLDKNGGDLVHTPSYGIADNRVSRVVRGSIDSTGNLDATLRVVYSGLEQDGVAAELAHLSRKDLLEQEQQSMGLPNCTIRDLNIHVTRAAVPSVEEDIRLTAAFATVSGKRLFISPGVFLKQVGGVGTAGTTRESEVELRTANQETDSIQLVVPHGYVLEGSLPDGAYATQFGSYRISAEMGGDALQLVFRFRQEKGVYPAADWGQLVKFFEFLHQDEGGELVFIRN